MARLVILQTALLCLEFSVCLSAIALFGLAYPNRFRTHLWEKGGVEGWNSNPKLRIYFYANHEEPPEVPLVWSQRLTDSNLALAILSLVVFVARVLMLRLGYLPKSVNILYDIILATLWVFSTVGQNSGDFSDPQHISEHPWYLTRGCSATRGPTKTYCQAARASFVVSVLAIVVYGTKVFVEALAEAYNRGKAQDQEWNKVEEEYSDSEVDEEDWQSQALSPVLAFYPASPRSSTKHHSGFNYV